MTDTDDRTQYLERNLTPLEIEDRKTIHMKLASEREENLAEIAGKRSEIRALNISRKKLDLLAAQVLREVRSGKVLEPVESRQGKLALEPVDPYAMFYANYPAAAKSEHLFDALHAALGPVEYAKLDGDRVRGWKPSTEIFDAVAHWARVENAHAAHAKRKPVAGMTLPARFEMPAPLQLALAQATSRALALATKRKPGKASKKRRGSNA